MSNAIYGTIVVDDRSAIYGYSDPSFSWVSYCAQSGFGLSFVTERKDLCFFETPKRQTIHFYLWDSFLNSNCEEFLYPIYIDSTGKSTEPKLIADLKKLNGLLELILQNQSVRMIELYFSDGCATLSDFRQKDVSLDGFTEWMLEQYRQDHCLPVVKVSLRRSSDK